MDEMKITSQIMKNAISKIANHLIRSKTGLKTNIKINDLIATISDNEAHMHIDIDANMPKGELVKLLAKIGI